MEGVPQVGCSCHLDGECHSDRWKWDRGRFEWELDFLGNFYLFDFGLEPTEFENAFFLAGTFSFEMQGDSELADGSVPPAGAALEIPSPGTNVSGIGLVSGWSCLGGELEVEFSDAEGVILTQTILQGSERLDTEPVCGDIDNGFSSLINWSLLGSGEKTAQLGP